MESGATVSFGRDKMVLFLFGYGVLLQGIWDWDTLYCLMVSLHISRLWRRLSHPQNGDFDAGLHDCALHQLPGSSDTTNETSSYSANIYHVLPRTNVIGRLHKEASR